MRHIVAALVVSGAATSGAALAQQAAAPPEKAQSCAACHGPNGNSTQPLVPILAGQTSRYLYLQLRDFQEGRRSDPHVTPMAAGLSRDNMFDLAAFFAAQRPRLPDFKIDEARAERGKRKADETLCTMCHLGGFAGQNEVPRVAGQNFDYIVKQLTEFKARKRTNDAGTMTSVANTLSEQDIQNLAHYLVGL